MVEETEKRESHGEKSVTSLEGFWVSPARPCDKDSMKVKRLKWLAAVTETMATDTAFSESVANYVIWKDNLMVFTGRELHFEAFNLEGLRGNRLGKQHLLEERGNRRTPTVSRRPVALTSGRILTSAQQSSYFRLAVYRQLVRLGAKPL
jgi:hypothetical protein